MKELPTQLHNAMIDGLTMLLTLRLSGSPAADTVAATAQTWSCVLAHGRAWDEARDVPRFQTAFMVLANEMSRWPSPKDFLDKIPPLPEPLKLEHRYHPTAEEKAKGKSALNRIQGVIKEVLRGKSLIPPPTETATEQILRNRAKVEAILNKKGKR